MLLARLSVLKNYAEHTESVIYAVMAACWFFSVIELRCYGGCRGGSS